MNVKRRLCNTIKLRETPKAVEYQGVVETLHWLRDNLRNGKKLSDDGSTITLINVLSEMGNPQPSS